MCRLLPVPPVPYCSPIAVRIGSAKSDFCIRGDPENTTQRGAAERPYRSTGVHRGWIRSVIEPRTEFMLDVCKADILKIWNHWCFGRLSSLGASGTDLMLSVSSAASRELQNNIGIWILPPVLWSPQRVWHSLSRRPEDSKSSFHLAGRSRQYLNVWVWMNTHPKSDECLLQLPVGSNLSRQADLGARQVERAA